MLHIQGSLYTLLFTSIFAWSNAPNEHQQSCTLLKGLPLSQQVSHTEGGTSTLRHFLLTTAGLRADWTMAEVLETQLKLIAEQVRGMRMSRRRISTIAYIILGE